MLCVSRTRFQSSPVCDSRPLAPAFSLSLPLSFFYSPSLPSHSSLPLSLSVSPLSRPAGASHKADSVLLDEASGCSCSNAVTPRAAAPAVGRSTEELHCKYATVLMERLKLSGLQRSLMRQAGQCFLRRNI